MNRTRLVHTLNDSWSWTRATHADVPEIVAMAENQFKQEVSSTFTTNQTKLTYHLHQAVLKQTFMQDQEFISVARHKKTNNLLSWNWVARGKFLPYADEEMAVAEFLHLDLHLPIKERVRLIGQTFDQWIAWCELSKVPVLCSTSIRTEQESFMRLHQAYGFATKGSFAYRRCDA